MKEKNGAKSGRSSEWHQTEDAKARIGEGVKRTAQEKKMGMDVSEEWKRFLLLRGAYPKTIAKLLDSAQNNNGENSGSPLDHSRSIDFARGLLEEGLIGEDLTGWRFLLFNYRNNRRKLPVSFFDMLRLEVFYKGIQQAGRGDFRLINLYRDTGSRIDHEGFEASLADEEDFVASLIAEKPEGIDVDRSGYYDEDDEGNRWRQPMEFKDGGMIFDSPLLALSRTIMRERKPGE